MTDKMRDKSMAAGAHAPEVELDADRLSGGDGAAAVGAIVLVILNILIVIHTCSILADHTQKAKIPCQIKG